MPLFRIVSGAISSELPLPLFFTFQAHHSVLHIWTNELYSENSQVQWILYHKRILTFMHLTFNRNRNALCYICVTSTISTSNQPPCWQPVWLFLSMFFINFNSHQTSLIFINYFLSHTSLFLNRITSKHMGWIGANISYSWVNVAGCNSVSLIISKPTLHGLSINHVTYHYSKYTFIFIQNKTQSCDISLEIRNSWCISLT